MGSAAEGRCASVKDTIIKGSGNSREIKSVPNFASLYPTWESFRDAFGTKGIPIDLLGLVAAGVDQIGTDLNKANLLTDSTEQAIWGSAADRTPDAALRQLRTLITTAQSSADGKLTAVTGSYTGSGTNTKTLNFSIKPRLVVVVRYGGILVLVNGFSKVGTNESYAYYDELNAVLAEKSVTWRASRNYSIPGNTSNIAYGYCCIGVS